MRRAMVLTAICVFLQLGVLLVTLVHGDVTPLRWPSGMFGLPKSMYGCPEADGFEWASGTISQALDSSSKHSTSFHLAANVTSLGVQRSFCIKDAATINPGPAWPPGDYCIYRKGKRCPAGFGRGSVTWNNRFSWSYSKARGVVPDGRTTSSNTLIYFCCASSGDKNTPISLPLESPFYLLAHRTKVCQEVRGALHRTEYIDYDTDGINSFVSPYPYDARTYKIRMYYCYYQACWANLTALNGTIMSPFYPTNYPDNIDCRWRIKVPPQYTLTLVIEDMNLQPSASCTKDWLLVTKRGKSLQSSVKYCTQNIYPNIVTTENLVVLDFHTNGDGMSSLHRGFRIHYFAVRIRDPMTTQLPVTKTTVATTGQLVITNATSNASSTLQPGITTTEQTDHSTDHSTDQTTDHSTDHSTDVRTTISTSPESNTLEITTELGAKSATPVPRQASADGEPQQSAWVVAVSVCLSILAVTVIVVLLYVKCLKKRDQIERRSSVVTYSKNNDYVDIETKSDVETEDCAAETKNSENPLYEPIGDSAKCEDNHLYESMYAMNYDSPRKTQTNNHVYESTSLPRQ